jgi:putative membrane protein
MTETKIAFFARIFLFIIYVVGLIGISIPSLKPAYVQLTPITLLISALILFAFHEPWNGKFILSIVLIYLGGFFVEYLGVLTGDIFGVYHYEETLGLKILDTPLIIGLNWVLLVYTSYYLASHLTSNDYLRLLFGGIFLVVFDLLLEPVAMKTGMWTWENGHPPFQNYLAWFIIGIVFMSFFIIFRNSLKNKVAGYLYFFMLMFFGILNLTL